MYLRSIAVENAGPIHSLCFDLSFQDQMPMPLVLVGPNGSGKSTLLSFIVNALVGFKQQAFERAEIERDRVYRVRSQRFIRLGQHWSHAKLIFDGGLELEEWVLDRSRSEFETAVSPLPQDEGWRKIPENETNQFALTPQPAHSLQRSLSVSMQQAFGKNVVLFFPSDRFELPDWLNDQALSDDLRFPEPITFQGQTSRRIFSRALLKPTLEWLKAVVLDSLLSGNLPFRQPSKDDKIVDFAGKVLAWILDADSDSVQFRFSHRNMGTIAVKYVRYGAQEEVPSLIGLSAGQAALFCAFCNVIRDFDLAGAPFNDIADVRGIVILDEADLHLHIDLQYRVLPQLMKLFPRVQFILTVHSPLLVMGLRNVFGDDGFQVRELPHGNPIQTEEFSEFNHALTAFTHTSAFDRRVLDRIVQSAKPVVMTEGKNDITHLQAAWKKLHPRILMPFEIVSSGGVATPKDDRGSADMLRTMLRACCLYTDRLILGLFDHDAEGAKQFNSLKTDGFNDGTDGNHRKHAVKPVHALILPAPPGRESFVTGQQRYCYLALEHYYLDALLTQHGLMDDPVAPGANVFCIKNDTRKKAAFAAALDGLHSSTFANFGPLFERIIQILGLKLEPAPLSPDDAPLEISTTSPNAFGFQATTIQVGASLLELPDDPPASVSMPEKDGVESPSMPPEDGADQT